LLILIAFELIFLAFAMVDLFATGKLRSWGITPREAPFGLVGCLIAPFIQSDITNFLVNLFPFFMLGLFVMLRENGIASFSFLVGMEIVVGGIMVWAVGRIGIDHNGSSGLIFAFFGYLVTFGFFRRDARAAMVAFVVVILYGGIIWGALPTREKISWEGHLCGFFVGSIFGAWEGEATSILRGRSDIGSSDEKKGLTADEPKSNRMRRGNPGLAGGGPGIEEDDRLNDADLDV